jgi:hypothetical protein
MDKNQRPLVEVIIKLPRNIGPSPRDGLNDLAVHVWSAYPPHEHLKTYHRTIVSPSQLRPAIKEVERQVRSRFIVTDRTFQDILDPSGSSSEPLADGSTKVIR